MKRRSKFSIASFVLSLIFFLPLTEILAIIFGITALIKIHKFSGALKGESMAIIGIVLGTVRLVFLILLTVFLFMVAPQLKPGFLEIKQNMKIARVHVDFLRLEQLINEYYKKYGSVPPDLSALKENGLVKVLPKDPFAKAKEFYKYVPEDEAKKIYPKADFLIYSVGPDGDDDGAQKQYLNREEEGDIIKVGRLKP